MYVIMKSAQSPTLALLQCVPHACTSEWWFHTAINLLFRDTKLIVTNCNKVSIIMQENANLIIEDVPYFTQNVYV